ncbi:MAG: replicative DNA helicase [Deltaproteobacteria bacterium]|nr:replicative DNA helicase [Deltaproteobacteria bacterium]
MARTGNGRGDGSGSGRQPPTFRPGDREPPNAPEAEKALLGAVLVDQTSLVTVQEQGVTPEDLFHPAHQRILEAMYRLQEQAMGVDAVTVANSLRDHGDLDTAGGVRYLMELVGVAAAPSSVEYYALIVRDKAAVRDMIGVAAATVSEGYAGDLEAKEFLDRAEQRLFQAGERRRQGAVRQLDDALDDAKSRLKVRREQQGVTGVPTEYTRLDERLLGFQPSDLVILAARPSMGKTSVALNLAMNASRIAGRHVMFVSLEMSEQQLADRLLCLQTGISSLRVREGRFLANAEVARMEEARDELRGVPLYIDDSSKLTVLEIRAKARRLKMKDQLDMVMIDYLQLIDPADKRVSREQQISEISRSLKAMAKELRIPVIALSQLSRAPETRPGKDKRPLLSDLRECVTGDTLVVLADGSRTPIRDLVGTAPKVVAVAGGRLVRTRAECVWSVGRRPVWRVRLASGRTVRATADHRLLGWEGFRKVADLAPGDRLALARHLPEPLEPEEWQDSRVVLLGHLIGDGSYLPHQPLRYTTASEKNSRAVYEAAIELGSTVTRCPGRGNWHQLVIAGNGNRWHPAGVGKWLRDLGIWGQRSPDKRVPAAAFRLSNRQVALLLRHLWATDGTISPRRTGRGSSAIAFSTCSPGLAADVAALLLRLGIVARVRQPTAAAGSVWSVSVSGADEQRRFLERVGAFGPRAAPACEMEGILAAVRASTNVDTLPREAWGEVVGAGLSQRAMACSRGTAYGGSSHFSFSPSRSVAAEYAWLVGSDRLADAATDDLFWDEVVEVRPDGEDEVFFLTVPGAATWLADGVTSHNSGAIEQDADVVMFLYRPEYYEREEEKKAEVKGILEIIIAKQRNGPTGTVCLHFESETMRVANLLENVPGYE